MEHGLSADNSLQTRGAIYVIYCKRPWDTRLYVGQTCQTIEERFQKHWNDGRLQMSRDDKCGIPMDDVMQCIGIKKLSVMCAELVPRATGESDKAWQGRCKDREQWWIRQLGTWKPFGHNASGVQHLTQQTYTRIRNTMHSSQWKGLLMPPLHCAPNSMTFRPPLPRPLPNDPEPPPPPSPMPDSPPSTPPQKTPTICANRRYVKSSKIL